MKMQMVFKFKLMNAGNLKEEVIFIKAFFNAFKFKFQNYVINNKCAGSDSVSIFCKFF